MIFRFRIFIPTISIPIFPQIHTLKIDIIKPISKIMTRKLISKILKRNITKMTVGINIMNMMEQKNMKNIKRFSQSLLLLSPIVVGKLCTIEIFPAYYHVQIGF